VYQLTIFKCRIDTAQFVNDFSNVTEEVLITTIACNGLISVNQDVYMCVHLLTNACISCVDHLISMNCTNPLAVVHSLLHLSNLDKLIILIRGFVAVYNTVCYNGESAHENIHVYKLSHHTHSIK
jgi:hypothetical protein